MKKPRINEIVLIVFPFEEPKPKFVEKQKAGIFGGVIKKVGENLKANQAVIILPKSGTTEKKQVKRLLEYAERVLGNRLLKSSTIAKTPHHFEGADFVKGLDFSNIDLAKKVRIVALGEHASACVTIQAETLRVFLESRGVKVSEIVEPPEYRIRARKRITLPLRDRVVYINIPAEDETISKWKERKSRLKKRGLIPRKAFGTSKKKQIIRRK